MKNNIRKNKGITLIALIITVVVVLILAAVTISAVSEGGIFQYANNAATKYNSATIGENTMLTNYLSELGKYDKGTQNQGTGIEYYYNVFEKDEETIEALMTVNYANNKILAYYYNEGYFYLGDEYNILEIVTDDFTVNLDGANTTISNGKGIKINHRRKSRNCVLH